MAEVENIVATAAQAATGTEASRAAAPREESEPVKNQKAQLLDLVNKIMASGLPLDVKNDLIRDIESALASGNFAALSNVLSRISAEAQIDIAEDAADDLYAAYAAQEQTFRNSGISRSEYLGLVRDSIPGYDDYSPATRIFIDQNAIDGLESSPALQDVIRRNQQQPEEVKARARAEQENNYEMQKALLADPAYDAYEKQLQDMKKFGLLKGGDAHDLLDKIKRHEITPEALQAEIERTKNKQNEHVAPIVQQMVDGLKDKEAKEYIRSKYTKPDGSLDVARMREDFSNISDKDKDDAIQAQLAGKATPEQKQIAMLSKVGYNTENAVAQQGLMGIMGRDPAFAMQMNNQALSDKAREQIAADRLRQEGYTLSRASLGIATAGFVDAVDETIKEGVAYGGSSYMAALNNNVRAEFQPSLHNDSKVASVRHYENWVAGQAQAEETYVSSDDILRLYAEQKAREEEAPSWIKKDPERYATWQKEQAEWKSLTAHTEEAMAQAAAAPPINTQPAAPKTEAEQAAEAAKLKEENPYARLDDLMKDPEARAAILAASGVAQDKQIVAGDPPVGDPPAQATPSAKVAQQGVGGPGV